MAGSRTHGGNAIPKIRAALFLLAACVAATLIAAPVRSATPVPIYVFAGQSNMVGYAATTHELAKVAPTLVQPQRNVQFFGPYDDYAVRYEPLAPPTEVRNVPYHSGFGPEVSAAASLSTLKHGASFGVVKFAVSGSSLYRRWNPETGDLYRAMLSRLRAAAKSMNAPVRFAGFFWMQGESDSNTYAHAQAYGHNLAHFIASVRRDLHNSKMPFVIGQIRDIRVITHLGSYSSIVRQKQLDVANADPYAFLVRSDGLELAPSSRLHFSTKGTVDLGRRMVGSSFGL